MNKLTLNRWQATYELPAENEKNAQNIAHGIAVEQTIEYPYELVTGTWFADELTGQIIDLRQSSKNTWQVDISYPSESVQGDFLQLLNMLYGNSSLQPGIRLIDFTLPPELLQEYPGPKFGIKQLRTLTNEHELPLLMAVTKPIGHSSLELANMAFQFAKGGFHMIKDDHSLYNQQWAPFKERITACVNAVNEANSQTGYSSMYLCNITADGTELIERALIAQEMGVGGVMISAALSGWSIIRQLSKMKEFTLPIIIHPAFSGPFIRTNITGISAKTYHGHLPRLVGADGVIFTGQGGRFSFSETFCQESQNGCLDTWCNLSPILPAVGGGISINSLPLLHRLYNNQIMLLVGGDLFRPGPDLYDNAAKFKEKVQLTWQ